MGKRATLVTNRRKRKKVEKYIYIYIEDKEVMFTKVKTNSLVKSLLTICLARQGWMFLDYLVTSYGGWGQLPVGQLPVRQGWMFLDYLVTSYGGWGQLPVDFTAQRWVQRLFCTILGSNTTLYHIAGLSFFTFSYLIAYNMTLMMQSFWNLLLFLW